MHIKVREKFKSIKEILHFYIHKRKTCEFGFITKEEICISNLRHYALKILLNTFLLGIIAYVFSSLGVTLSSETKILIFEIVFTIGVLAIPYQIILKRDSHYLKYYPIEFYFFAGNVYIIRFAKCSIEKMDYTMLNCMYDPYIKLLKIKNENKELNLYVFLTRQDITDINNGGFLKIEEKELKTKLEVPLNAFIGFT